jgi:hypothetical protein
MGASHRFRLGSDSAGPPRAIQPRRARTKKRPGSVNPDAVQAWTPAGSATKGADLRTRWRRATSEAAQAPVTRRYHRAGLLSAQLDNAAATAGLSEFTNCSESPWT